MTVDYKEKYYEMMEKNLALMEQINDSKQMTKTKRVETTKETKVETTSNITPYGTVELIGSSKLEVRYGMKKFSLNKELLNRGIQYKWANSFTIHKQYNELDYVRYVAIRDDNSNVEKFQMRWTPKGVAFLDSIFMK